MVQNACSSWHRRSLAVQSMSPLQHRPARPHGRTVQPSTSMPRRLAEGQIMAVAVQASLLACRSFPPEILAHLGRRRAVSRRYLMVEGHRALFAMEAILPRSVRSVIDRSLATRSTSSAASLSIAMSGEPINDPPAEFGAIVVRALRASATRSDPDSDVGAAHVPRSITRELLEELHDDDDDDDLAVDILSEPDRWRWCSRPFCSRGCSVTSGRRAVVHQAPTLRPIGPGAADHPAHRLRPARLPLPGLVFEQPLEGRGTTYPNGTSTNRRTAPSGAPSGKTTPRPREHARASSRHPPAASSALSSGHGTRTSQPPAPRH